MPAWQACLDAVGKWSETANGCTLGVLGAGRSLDTMEPVGMRDNKLEVAEGSYTQHCSRSRGS